MRWRGYNYTRQRHWIPDQVGDDRGGKGEDDRRGKGNKARWVRAATNARVYDAGLGGRLLLVLLDHDRIDHGAKQELPVLVA